MIEAAKKAEAHEFILQLEDPEGRKGYDARVGERGVKLSGRSAAAGGFGAGDLERCADFGAG